ncbi:MAG: TldD/PmbA family protein [Planctomycetes bacterium]|nr:TldD/PmbA family protein [Planctomycetota bacterium]
MKQLLEEIVRRQGDYLELRFQETVTNSFMAQKGRVDQSSTSTYSGVGVRILVEGSWGFSTTSDTARPSIERAVELARENAVELSKCQKHKVSGLARGEIVREDYVEEGYEELVRLPIEARIEKVVAAEKELLKESSRIHTAMVGYKEILENRTVVTSDGASCTYRVARPEFRARAMAGSESEQQSSHNSVGVTGGWTSLFAHPSMQGILASTAREVVELLSAAHAEGGRQTVILSPALVGLLCHEAIGHTVEADFVLAGSVAKEKIGQRVASDLITLCDGGRSHHGGFPAGALPFDDEGVRCSTTTIIENGLLKNYLHNKETAHIFGVEPRGNARAWSFSDEPLVRMTNTWLEPGDSSLEEMIAATDQGLLIIGAGGGQADATGEFMFGSSYAYEIKGGKRGKMLREVSLSGVAFDVLQTVDMVSSDFLWDLGSGYCGKGQPAKVDAGGPHIRCSLTVGGRREED